MIVLWGGVHNASAAFWPAQAINTNDASFVCRMTAEEALQHPFIGGPSEAAPSPVSCTKRGSPRHIMLSKSLLDTACEIAER